MSGIKKVQVEVMRIWSMRVGKLPLGPIVAATLAALLVLLIVLGGGKKKRVVPAYIPVDSAAVADSIARADSTARADATVSQGMRVLLEEANRSFTYQQTPIHPFAIRDLLASVSDSYPGPIALDVAGSTGSNRYAEEWIENPDGSVTSRNPSDDYAAEEPPNNGYFTYRRVGGLPNGWHVLRTGDNGGGSGVFETLLLVRFRVDTEYGESTRQRLILERRGVIPLGDRYAGQVQIHGDSINLSADIPSGQVPVDKAFGFADVE